MNKNKEVKRRHYFWIKVLRFIVGPFFRTKYQYKKNKIKIKNLGPCLILSNHTNTIDPIMLSLNFDVPIYFMASELIFNIGIKTKVLKYLVNPISKTKSLSDISAVKKTIKIISEGGTVAIFPEGNCTYDGSTTNIPYAITKLIKHLQVPVIFYNTEGLYLSNPRWSIYSKKGFTAGFVKRIWQKDEYNHLSEDEIYQTVKNELYVNCYTSKEKHQYIGKHIAEGLERLVFICPECHDVHHMKTINNELYCQKCGFSGKYNEYGYLKTNKKSYSMVELNALVKKDFLEYMKKHFTEQIFIDNGLLIISYPTYRINKGLVEISINNEGIKLIQKDKENIYSFDEISNVAIQTKRTIIIYLKNNPTILVRLPKNVSPYKYLLAYQIFEYYFKNGNLNDFTIDKMGI